MRTPSIGARVLVLATVLAVMPVMAEGQAARMDAPAAVPREQPMVETAPLRCWWRASKGAVSIGEPFDVRLTCAVLETEGVQVVPDEARLTAAAVQLRPFEVLGGEHPADTRAGPRRFFQYRYTVRLLETGSIGQDVALPNLAITYKVQSRVSADAVLTGRDFTYVMPGLVIRILSLAPDFGVDIRDGADAGLERLEALQFQARLFDIASLTLAAGGVLLGALALAGLVGRTRAEHTAERPRPPGRRVLAAAEDALARVARESAHGWTPELVSAGHAALRVVAAVALGRDLGEQPLPRGSTPVDGRLAVRPRNPVAPGVAVTSPATASDVSRALHALPAAAPAAQRAGLEAVRDALQAFTVARFASGEFAPDPVALSAATEAGRAEAARLAREHRWSSLRDLMVPGSWRGRTVRS